MVILYLFLGISIFLISSFLFKKASGTLSIKKLNIISFTYYNLVIFSYLGAMIILLGFREHYMVEKIRSDEVIIKTCLFLAYTFIVFPLVILIYAKLFVGKDIKGKYDKYIYSELKFEKKENLSYSLMVICTAIGIFATVHMFMNIGSVPLFTALFGKNSSLGMLREDVTRNYTGNLYVRNILVLTLTPLLSYFSYIYMRVSKTKKKQWILLFALNAVLAILIKTYNLEKAPVIYWLFYFYILEVVLGNKNAYKMLKYLIFLFILMIVFMYLGGGYSNRFLTLSSGPLSRILITQVSTLFLHVQAFPVQHPFLNGASLPRAVAWLAGSSQSWVRSGRIVMQIYNPKGVASGEAGVMNAMFLGEAYANWGIGGVLFSSFVVALPLVISFAILLRQEKTPLTILLYLSLFITFTGSLQGGFIDYVYNSNFILFIIIALFFSAILNRGKIKIR